MLQPFIAKVKGQARKWKMRRENKYKVTQSDHRMSWSWSAVIPISTLPCVALIEIIEKLFYTIQKKVNDMN